MKFEVIATAVNGRGYKGRNNGVADSTVLLTINKARNNRDQIALRIGRDVMKAQRWLVGDKVVTRLVRLGTGQLAFHIERSTTEGHTLSGPKEDKGKMETATIRLTSDAMLHAVIHLAGYSNAPAVVDSALLFILGEQQ